MTQADVIAAFVDRDFPRETEFLAELVKVPSDNLARRLRAARETRAPTAGPARSCDRDA